MIESSTLIARNSRAKRAIAITVVLFASVIILFGWLWRQPLIAAVRAFDARYCNLVLRDLWGRLYWREDWDSIPLAYAYSFDWVNGLSTVRIAHALGDSGGPLQNSLMAARRSVDRGFSLLEVDIWRDPTGLLRCHHGDDAGRASLVTIGKNECTARQLLRAVANWPSVYLVTDFKTDFESTAAAFLALAQQEKVSAKIIIQLYEPDHLRLFVSWHSTYALPGPIVTTYRSHLPIWRVQSVLEARGYRVIAIPADSIRFANPPLKTTRLLTHPIHDCDSMSNAVRFGIHGFYMLNSISC